MSIVIFLLLSLFQNVEASVTVLLKSSDNQPLVRERVEFASEPGVPHGSCITDTNGRCTITLVDVPIDASGLIRGKLITEHGQRPLIFKGEQIEITLTLEDGQLNVPSDAYVTRTPEPVLTSPIATSPTLTSPTVTELVVTEPAITEPVVTEPVVTEPVVTEPVVTEPAATDIRVLFTLGCLILLILAYLLGKRNTI